ILGSAGCGDDEDGGTDSGMNPDAGGEVLVDQCTNDSDMAATMAIYDGKDIVGHATDCGLACSSDPDVQGCSQACILERTMNAVSAGCASCYSLSVLCAFDNCLAACIADPGAPACTACR